MQRLPIYYSISVTAQTMLLGLIASQSRHSAAFPVRASLGSPSRADLGTGARLFLCLERLESTRLQSLAPSESGRSAKCYGNGQGGIAADNCMGIQFSIPIPRSGCSWLPPHSERHLTQLCIAVASPNAPCSAPCRTTWRPGWNSPVTPGKAARHPRWQKNRSPAGRHVTSGRCCSRASM